MMRILQQNYTRGLLAGRTRFLSTSSTSSLLRSFTRQQQPSSRSKLSAQLIPTNPAANLWCFGLTMPSRAMDNGAAYVAANTLVQAASKQMPQHLLELGPKIQHEMIDRPHEVKKLYDAVKNLERQDVAIVYVTGEPGIGKTQVARKYAEEYYSQWYRPLSKTALTLDMSDFHASYRKLAGKIGTTDATSLYKVAGEIKSVLEYRSSWLLILDNYNSTDFEGFDRDSLEKHLLPLQEPSNWGTGTVLVTTHNAGVIPACTPQKAIVTIDPLSTDESAELVGLQVGSYKPEKEEKTKLTGSENELLKEAIRKRGWRNVPVVMAHIGEYVKKVRDYTDAKSYGLKEYLKDLEKGEATDPEELYQRHIELALQRMTNMSDNLKKVFAIFALCPENGIPLVLLERLMKSYYKKKWLDKLIEIKRCTVLHTCQGSKNEPEQIRSHKVYHQVIRNTATPNTDDREFLVRLVDCFSAEANETRDESHKRYLKDLLEEIRRSPQQQVQELDLPRKRWWKR